jgi:ABC-2 type transport system permease protein
MTAVTVSTDMNGGITDRFRSLDVSGRALVAGHVAASAVRNAASTVLVLAVAFLIGFRPHAGVAQWPAAAGVLLAWILAVSWSPPRSACSPGPPRRQAGSPSS